MQAVDIIIKKRDGYELTKEEINFFVEGYTADRIPEYQAAAWAMAVLLKGMTPLETANLTFAMVHSGETVNLSDIVPIAADKHSTGGVGDKTSLVVGPVVASCGLPVAKMSGRGLGFSGGTLDKLESIPGFRVNLTIGEFLDQLKSVGLVICGQSVDLAPADGKFYALRDVTGTVPSIPLIASSIMCKKIAVGAKVIVLDVKVGNGAFMKNMEQATELAKLMVAIGQMADRKVMAVLSDMNQPLGQAVGNSLELIEALDTLKGAGPSDFREHCVFIASHMLLLAGLSTGFEEARSKIETHLQNGSGFNQFKKMISAQGGDLRVIEEPGLLPLAKLREDLETLKDGYIKEINAQMIGETVARLGGGRLKKGDPIDYGVGILVNSKVGQNVEKGEPIFTIYANDGEQIKQARADLKNACTISDEPVDICPLFYGTIY